MIKGLYLRERKAIKIKRRAKVLIGVAILLVLYRIIFNSFSIYESQADSTADIDVAFYVLGLDDTEEEQTISLDSLTPDGKSHYCKFTVSNYKIDDLGNTIISETNMEYDLKIRTTTNMPLVYKLYRDVDASMGGTSIIDFDKTVVYSDEDNTLFNRFIKRSASVEDKNKGITDTQTFNMSEKKSYNYTLEVIFEDTVENRDISKQNLIEGIEITVDSRQAFSI